MAPFLKRYCLDCHGGAEPKGELALDRMSDQDASLAHGETWARVLENLEAETMPPDDRPRPAADERAAIIDWIKATIPAFQCDGPRDPGRVTVRRLNRTQYNNTIRDLLGIDYRPADDFPADDVGYGFDNIGDVLTLPPLLLEKYLAAAHDIVDRAILVHDPRRTATTRYSHAQLRATPGRGRALEKQYVLYYVGAVYIDHPVEVEGDYLLRVRAGATQYGTELARMGIRVDGHQQRTVAVIAAPKAPHDFEFRLHLRTGKRRLSAAYLNDHTEPPPDDRKEPHRDRNLFIEWLEVEGPLDLEPTPLPESHQRVVIAPPPAQPPADPEQRRDAWCEALRTNLERFAARAYRRPLAAEELGRLMVLAESALDDGASFEEALQVALAAVLVSPHFLFMVEGLADTAPAAVDQPQDAPPGAAPGSQSPAAAPPSAPVVVPLTPYELATRLSYFLWNTMPDEQLFARASDGSLSRPEVLAGEARRMLADPRSLSLVDQFAMQWLQLGRLDDVEPDPDRFPQFDDALRQAMREETEQFLAHLIREDRSVLELLDADYTFVNERLARHYGLDGPEGEAFVLVHLPANHPRGGVLTQASVLTTTSNPTRTSPVKRGKWVLEQLLDSPPPPPPPGVPELEQVALSGTLRQQMEQHRTNPACANCHARMDALGFALENFDAIGAWRDHDGDAPIDASGILPDGQAFAGPQQLRQVLAARGDEFCRALIGKLLTYALGRGLEPPDRCVVDDVLAALAAEDYRFSALVAALIQSEPFRFRTAQGASP